MRRNNMFMWAYITIIIVSVIVRLFYNYSQWKDLVIAITISSIFFAAESLIISRAKVGRAAERIGTQIVKSVQERIDLKLNLGREIDDAILTYQDKQDELLALKDRLAFAIRDAEELRAELQDLEKVVANKGQQAAKLQKWANIFAYAGFLSLFSILIFFSEVKIPICLQEGITVLSFAIILVANQFSSAGEKNIERLIQEDEKWNARQEEDIRQFLRVEYSFERYITGLDVETREERRRATHAD